MGSSKSKRSLHALSQFRSLKISFEQIRQKRKEEKQSQKQADEAPRKAQIEYDIKNKDFGGPLIIYPKGRSYHPGHCSALSCTFSVISSINVSKIMSGSQPYLVNDAKRPQRPQSQPQVRHKGHLSPLLIRHTVYSYQYVPSLSCR